MKLIQMTATFGCLQNETLRLDEGMTLLHAPNGAGKSTWCAFLRTMLYGLDTRQRDRKGVLADKNRYRPWSGAPMEGLLVCQWGDKIIEIRRTSAGGVPMGDFSAVDRATGLPEPGLTADNVGEVLTGVGREVFDRSVFLRQSDLAVTQSRELEKRLAALVSAGEEDVSWSEADGLLRTWQRRRRYHKTGLLPQLEQEEETLLARQRQTAGLRQDLAQVQARAEGLRRQSREWDDHLEQEAHRRQTEDRQRQAEAEARWEAARQRVQHLDQEADEDDDLPEDRRDQEIRAELRSRRRLMTALVVVVVLITLACAALYLIPTYIEPNVAGFPLDIPPLPLFFYGAVAGALWLLVFILTIAKSLCDRRSRKELRALQAQWETARARAVRQEQARRSALDEEAQARRYLDVVERQGASAPALPPEAEACRQALHRAEQEEANLRGQLEALGDPAQDDARLDSVRAQMAWLQADYDALDVALDALQEADRELHARVSPRLSRRAGEYFSRLTQGRYTQVSLDRNMDLVVREGTSLADRPLGSLSQGTADLLYLSLRLAVADLALPDPDQVPLVLDDALVTLDDDHLDRVLDTLAELAQTRQVLLFSCQRREQTRLANRPEVRVISLAGACQGGERGV